MPESPAPRIKRPRLWRMQFSLAGIFALMTLSAVGTWYWHQRPYAVERWLTYLDPVCGTCPPPPGPIAFREVQHFRRLRGGKTIAHGPYRAYDLQNHLLRAGRYRNGQRHGDFLRYDAAGQIVFRQTFVADQLQGPSTCWHAPGKLASIENYLNGKQYGRSCSWNASGNLIEEDHYDRGVLHGSFDHRLGGGERLVQGSFEHGLPSGKWTWFPLENDAATIVGQWRDGLADGRWEWRDSDGQRYLLADFSGGRITQLEPGGLSPRILEDVVRSTSSSAERLAEAFELVGSAESAATVNDVVKLVHRELSYRIQLDPDALRAAGLSADEPVNAECYGQPALLILAKMLKPRGLGYDLRYGTLCVDSLESIASWQDATGMTQIVPPAGSKLDAEWDRGSFLDVVEMPLSDVVTLLSDMHDVRFDTSRIPATNAGDTPVWALDSPLTLSLRDGSFKDTLATLLGELGCKATLRGETIVIEPQ